MSGPESGRSKVARVLAEYDLESLDLAARWTGARGERTSLRDLATLVNRRVLGEAMRRAGMNPLDGEVANLYRLLVADDVSSGARREAERTLERAGLDVDELCTEFVSHRAVHTYLRDHLGVDPPSNDAASTAAKAASLERLVGRTRRVTRDSLERLRDADDLAVDEFEVSVDVRVFCERCGTTTDLAVLLDAGGCDCRVAAERPPDAGRE